MPFPPPPPPPPGLPPPPTFAPAAPPPVSAEGRNMLLQSIRQGATLKKTVTNDKSGPVIPGGRPSSSSSTNTSSSSSGSPRSNGGLNGSATLGRSNGLAGLFAGGMPKLKPTGVDIGQPNNSQSLTSLPSATAPGKQEQTRRQFNVDIKNRGPPPKPPPANQKPSLPQDDNFLAMRAKLRPSDRQKSFSSDRLDSPALYRPLSVPTTPSSVRARPVSSYYSVASPTFSSSPSFQLPPLPARNNSNQQFSPTNNLNQNSTPKTLNESNMTPAFQFPPPSVKNFPNTKSPPLNKGSPQKTPQSPGVFKFPSQPSKNLDSFGTFPARIPHVNKVTGTTRSGKVSSRRPVLTITPADTDKPSMYALPPLTPHRNEYNRFRDSSTTGRPSSGSLYSPALPTSPRPKPATVTLLSKPAEFKIQRPQLSPAVGKTESSLMSTSDSVLTGPLHNRSNSTTSLNTNSAWTQPIPKVAMKAPPGGYGKPNVAPKPPGIASKSPGKLVNGRASVTRAQSMRAPRSPPVAPPQGQIIVLPNQSELYRGAPTFHQSQDSLLHTPPPPKHHTLPSPRVAPNRPPLRPPQTRPPPPPPNRVVMTSPPCPPPPPPTQAPPPPPHRVPMQTHRIPPVPASLNPAPPPPPARHSSMRNGLPSSFSSKLEARFAERFHVKEEFPPPQTFKGFTKVYNSRTAKQPAPQPPPQPPPHIQLHWPRDNSSTC